MATRNTKGVRPTYRNFKTLLKNIKDLNKRNGIPCSRTRRLSFEKKKSVPSKLFQRFYIIPMKSQQKLYAYKGVYMWACVFMHVHRYFFRGQEPHLETLILRFSWMKFTVKNCLKTQEQQGWYEGIPTELEEQKSPEVDPYL